MEIIFEQDAINNTHHSVVKSGPSKLMFGYEQREHADFPLTQFTQTLAGVDVDLAKIRSVSRDTVT